MKLAIIACIVSCIWLVQGERKFFKGRRVGGNVPPPVGPGLKISVVESYFDQILDHSDPTNQITWKQKYFVNEEFFNEEKRDVAFLMIGGEGRASSGWMTQGAWIDTAQQHGALCFQVEHRFYGDSQPFDDLKTENLRYLTSEQAIDDLATFIVKMTEEYKLSKDVKWIAFGGSYSGSLAAWLRQKYPHLVYGASSASGPLLAIVDFQDYFKVITEDLRTLGGQECVDAVQKGSQLLDKSIQSLERDIDTLLNLCTPVKNSLENPKDLSNLFETMADNFAGVAQYNNDNRNSNVVNINDVCDIMVNASIGDELDRLASVNKLLQGENCLNFLYEDTIREMKNDSLNSSVAEGSRQWVYQTCTEFGFYQTSTNEPQIFGNRFPIDFFTDMCADIYGPEINATFIEKVVERTNAVYGALDIQVSNVVFVHGTIDPWHPLGITETQDSLAPAILINGTAHCANMYQKSEYDLPQLTAAREEVDKIVGLWLQSQ